MSDKSAGHWWEFEQDTYFEPDPSGRWQDREIPTGYGHFRCSCGVFEHGRMAEVTAKGEAHLEAVGERPYSSAAP
jgi:hypothetical protein